MKTRYEICADDNLPWLRSLADNSIDSVVTDPPYGLGDEPDMVECLRDWLDHGYHEVGGRGFMGKTWDAFVPQPIFWKEVYRVLKPGGYVVSFGGTRTYDLMALAVRLAGFEIRDMCEWLYGSGFPKSHNVSKAIDREAGAERGERLSPKAGHEKHVGKDNMKSLRESGALSGKGGFSRPWMRDPQKVEDAHWNFAPSTESAKQWDGFGSALKPAHEPILIARKPLEKGLTIAQNVQKWGTGGLNIDGARIGVDSGGRPLREVSELNDNVSYNGASLAGRLDGSLNTSKANGSTLLGRFPSNILLANVPSVIGLFPETVGCKSPSAAVGKSDILRNGQGEYQKQGPIYGESGSASRYFFRADMLPIEQEECEALPIHLKAIYCGKPSKMERNMGGANKHCTVKPVSLMLHLVTLVTPPNGVCCDPFMGSGTTGIATMLASPKMQFLGCDLEPDHLAIAGHRIKNWKHYRQFVEVKAGDSPARVKANESKVGVQTSLF